MVSVAVSSAKRGERSLFTLAMGDMGRGDVGVAAQFQMKSERSRKMSGQSRRIP